ncbi:hypothetical protein ACJX0J_004937 (mitochondrion) [Zea mays]
MSRAPTVYPLFYYFPPLILESAHNCGVFIVGLKLLPKVSLKIEIFFGLDAQIDGIAANSIFIPFISIPLNLIHLEGGNFQCALGLIARLRQRIDGASLQNRFRPNEFKAVFSENNNMLSLKIQKPIYIISSLHLDRCYIAYLLCILPHIDFMIIIRWFGNQKTFLKSLPYKAGKLYAVSATKRRLENRFHLLYPLLGMKNMLLSQFIGIKLFNVGEKQKKQLLYSKFIILLYLHFLSIYFKEASNMTFSNEVFASPL